MGDRSGIAMRIAAKFEKAKTKNGTPILEASKGIFTSATRRKVLGIKKQTEPHTNISQFWWKRRNEVERTLIDLDLFIEAAGKDNVNQVITRESLAPVIEALLWHPIVDQAEPDLNLAEIAQMLVQIGIYYLRGGKRPRAYQMPAVIGRTLEDAIELSHVLVSDIKIHKQALIQERKELAKARADEKKKQSPSESDQGDSRP